MSLHVSIHKKGKWCLDAEHKLFLIILCRLNSLFQQEGQKLVNLESSIHLLHICIPDRQHQRIQQLCKYFPSALMALYPGKKGIFLGPWLVCASATAQPVAANSHWWREEDSEDCPLWEMLQAPAALCRYSPTRHHSSAQVTAPTLLQAAARPNISRWARSRTLC